MGSNGIALLLWEYPWPGYGGSDLRNQFLITEISKEYPVDLLIFSRALLHEDQYSRCRQYCRSVTVVPNSTDTLWSQFMVGARAMIRQVPFHTAIIERSFLKHLAGDGLRFDNRIVYCSQNMWGTIATRWPSTSSWILDQHNADLEFWRIYASETLDWKDRLVRKLNFRLAASHFPELYKRVGCVVSVCEEDRNLTQAVCPSARVEVVENPVDCVYFSPNRIRRNKRPSILFTGTYNDRNLCALRRFMVTVLPKVRQQLPELEFVLGGTFYATPQAELRKLGEVTFTGAVPDLRPTYDACDVFVNPFWNGSYGSKLKVAQAMAMGMCVITSVDGARGVPVSDNETALVARDEDEFVSMLLRALTQEETRIRIGAAARQLALQKLDWPIVGRRLREIIKSVDSTRSYREESAGCPSVATRSGRDADVVY